MVILDSDHSTAHVRKEPETYAPCVTLNSYMLVHDGVTDDIPALGQRQPPGPLYAIRDFLTTHKEFEIDRERCERRHYPAYRRLAEKDCLVECRLVADTY